jgi:hypothetical protein
MLRFRYLNRSLQSSSLQPFEAPIAEGPQHLHRDAVCAEEILRSGRKISGQRAVGGQHVFADLLGVCEPARRGPIWPVVQMK